MTNTFDLSYEYLEAIKELLLKNVAIEDQSRIMIGFLDEVDSWIHLKDIKYGYKKAVKFRDEEIERYKKDLADLDCQHKMAMFVKDDNIRALWKISEYLWKLKENKKRLDLFSCKAIWNFTVSLFEKCEPYIKSTKISALQSITDSLIEIRPSTVWYFSKEYRRLIEGFNAADIPWDINCNDVIMPEKTWRIILLPLHMIIIFLTYLILKII